ncbi:MAG: hypothetical protein GWM98_14130 [Nitrospinaceae bacterium]|nr:hypothetical protein [Nitrospinaceae bacterium]NIR55408.1 hypothetical protein [Nitrospinaceae bacterium]NIS85848.1 hypothetical protein [Nitrospinaceae bacterium]NIT82692.1 hypothetical protein [Nitrospinaceae bacterium]NIU44904.1 hypothetical protein [Nitrospinaceae bacterium]
MSSLDSVSSASGLSPQFAAAATQKAQDVQKQEGQAALQLIQSAIPEADTSDSGGGTTTGSIIDVTV